MTRPRSGRAGRALAAAAGAMFVLLTMLSVGTGLGPVGWLCGVGYLAGLCALLAGPTRRAQRAGDAPRSASPGLGPADLVTLGRAVLVGGVTALVGDWLVTGRMPTAVLVALAAVALALDAVDGRVARRTGTASARGARFDMEVDAVLVLVLSGYVAALLGPWTLAIGAMRYVFAVAGRILPWLRSPLPVRYSAKVVAALQGVVLVLAAADVLPRPATAAVVGLALGMLVWSFGHDVRWLWRHAEPGTRLGARARAAGILTALAGLLVFGALVAPNRFTDLTPLSFLRIPVEGMLAVAVVLLASARAGRRMATVVGAVLGVLTVLTLLDLGFSAALDRTFDPVIDWGLASSVVDLLTGSLGRVGAIAAVIGIGLFAAAVVALVALSARRLAGVVVRRRVATTRSLAVLAPAWLVCAVVGAQLVPGVPVASASASTLAYDRARQVRHGLLDHQVFLTEAGTDAFRGTPAEELLTGLRGKDVMIAFVESYGRDAVEAPNFAPQMDALLDDGTRRLSAAGFAARSGWLTSPTAGGNSWLAHSTLLSGLWVDNQQRYDSLLAGQRLTLTRAFGQAGWRTVSVQPGATYDSPEGPFYGYQTIYDVRNLGYRGPNLGWASTPDQYSLAAFQRAERAAPGHPPVLAEMAMVSSHAPWPLIPDVLDWDAIGDGSVYQTMTTGEDREAIWAKGTDEVRSAYRRSLEYSLSSLVSYVQTYGDDNLVLIFLGDHQPAPLIIGEGAGREVPITVVARDPAVLDRISDWGWTDGLKPAPQAPVWRMDSFRDRFLTAFGPRPDEVLSAHPR